MERERKKEGGWRLAKPVNNVTALMSKRRLAERISQIGRRFCNEAGSHVDRIMFIGLREIKRIEKGAKA